MRSGGVHVMVCAAYPAGVSLAVYAKPDADRSGSAKNQVVDPHGSRR